MAKKVKDSERFVISWGKRKNGMCFFVSHKDIPHTPRPTNPEHLVKVLKEAIEYIESNNKDPQFIENWMSKR